MQINPVNQFNSNNNVRPAFGAKIGPSLKALVKDDPRYDGFMKMFSNWGDSNSVVDIYHAQIDNRTKYRLMLKNNVLDETKVPFRRGQSEFLKKNLINRFFDLTPETIWWAENSLFKNVKSVANSSKPHFERLSNIIESHKKEGIVFDARTLRRYEDS